MQESSSTTASTHQPALHLVRHLAHLGLISLCTALAPAQSTPPAIASGGIRNAADYGTALAPGAMVSIFGTNLAPRTTAASAVPLPTTLEGVTVEAVSGFTVTPLPLYFVSPGQINAQLPYTIAGTSLPLRVRTAGGTSASQTITISPRAPRLFTRTMDGKGEAILLHAATYRLVTESEPAAPGEYLILYLTGLGEVSPAIQPGRPGGDGGALGALNRVTATVTATISGQNAPVVFAGLAPGFVGVYQLNIQAPPGLAAGKPWISVLVSSVSSQGNVWISAGAAAPQAPEDVLRRALEAQARGDITALLGECNSLDGKPAASTSRKVFEVVQRMARFSDFRFTHLATAQGDKGTLSLVRAKVSYTVAVGGVTQQHTFGLLGVMKKVASGWKVAAIVPDELLNLEAFADANPGLTAKSPKQASALDLKAANQAINDAMKGGYVHEDKLGVAITMGIVGQLGPAGDLAANSHQVYETLVNIGDVVTEVWANGLSPIGWAKAEQVGVGIFQIVAEPVPGMDAFADSVQASLDQYVFNLEIMRGLQQLKLQLFRAPIDGLRFSPQLAMLEPFQFSYPAGMEISGDPDLIHAAGTPVRSIIFKSFHSIGHRLPLRVLGEMPIAKGAPLYPIADRIGGKLRGDTYYIPVDVTHLVSGELASGDILLDNYARYRGEKSGARVLLWDANCRRGRQLLRVSLRNGETTPVVNVVNWFMNVISDYRLTNLDAGNQFKLTVGGERPFTVGGSSSLMDQSLWPDLTPWSACFDMAVKDPAIASLERGPTTKLKGVAKGATELILLLPGSAGDPGVVDLTSSVPVIVEQGPSLPAGNRFTAQVGGTQHIRYRNGTAGTTTTYLEVVNSAQVPVVWSGGRVTVKGTFIDSGGFRETEIDVSGTLDPARMMFTQFRATTTRTSKGFAGVTVADNWRVEINATNLPLQSCNSTMSNCTWVLNGTVAAPAVTVKASYEHIVDSKLDAARSWDYVTTDWSSVNAKLYVALSQ
ncbi:MAG: hypothetical protein J0L64_21905 [Acidobacteria bacterium]|nr:hypothetical protein [Acidobacteriota bacterium]